MKGFWWEHLVQMWEDKLKTKRQKASWKAAACNKKKENRKTTCWVPDLNLWPNPQDLKMWNESGIKTCPCKQVQIRTWTANLVRLTMWETVYQAESPQLNIDPCGSFCPSKTREANNKHIYIIPPVSWCWCPKGSAGSVFLCFTCMQLCEFCVCVCVSLPAHHCRVMWLDPLLFIYNWNGTDWQIREKWMSEVSLLDWAT